MDAALELNMYEVGHEEEWEEIARYKLEAMVAAGNRNAKEAVGRFAGWQKRRGISATQGVFAVRTSDNSDVLMRIQVRELSDLARMGIIKAIRALEEIRVAKITHGKDVKKMVDHIHRKILGELSTC